MEDNQRLGARFDNTVARKFKSFCDARGENYSSVIRRLVLTELARYQYLSDEQAQALGVDSSEA